MINVAICDDETVIIEYLQSIIGKLAMGINERIIIDGFNSSTDFIKMLDNGEKYDFIFRYSNAGYEWDRCWKLY